MDEQIKALRDEWVQKMADSIDASLNHCESPIEQLFLLAAAHDEFWPWGGIGGVDMSVGVLFSHGRFGEIGQYRNLSEELV